MVSEKVMAAQRAMELLEKMQRWDMELSIKKIAHFVENPYQPEFETCMAIVNS